MNAGESAQAVSLPPQALSNDTARKRLLLTKSPEPKVESLASSEDDSAKDSNPFLSKALGTRKFDKPSSLSSLPLIDEKLVDVKDVIVTAGLNYTVIDADPFYPTVIRKFISNIMDAEERADGVDVLENIDRVCGYLTDNRVKTLENMRSKFLTLTNQVLYKLVCSK
ncbi:hypothetical protein DY000_02039324 [Brassica cretica]|uniref:Uncharacterized protein n=1 Tax=Brassica cretica TaxID=69181 RepID=A0ABQ7BIM5_BRACR|nr:hypothetical protein DY000_02039324 [Brassica cretica]